MRGLASQQRRELEPGRNPPQYALELPATRCPHPDPRRLPPLVLLLLHLLPPLLVIQGTLRLDDRAKALFEPRDATRTRSG